MTNKPPSPFAGIKLTEPARVPAHGADQRLFVTSPRPALVSLTQPPSRESTKEGRNLGSKEPGKIGRQEGLATSVHHRELFDIRVAAYKNNTYAFTDEELQALEDLSIELRRQYDVHATKNSLIRLGLHLLIENHRANKTGSFAVRRLRKTEDTTE